MHSAQMTLKTTSWSHTTLGAIDFLLPSDSDGVPVVLIGIAPVIAAYSGEGNVVLEASEVMVPNILGILTLAVSGDLCIYRYAL
jgi:hypothetical protein